MPNPFKHMELAARAIIVLEIPVSATVHEDYDEAEVKEQMLAGVIDAYGISPLHIIAGNIEFKED